jgi:hypothetical protein
MNMLCLLGGNPFKWDGKPVYYKYTTGASEVGKHLKQGYLKLILLYFLLIALYELGWDSCNASDVYSGGTKFKSRRNMLHGFLQFCQTLIYSLCLFIVPSHVSLWNTCR